MRSRLRAMRAEGGVKIFVVFLLAFLWFLVFQFHSGVADPDAFYHIKMAQLLVEQGTVPDFPWLSEMSIFAYSFADQHILYHLLLAPFVRWGDPIAGAKVSQAVFAASSVVVLYGFLRWLKIPRAGLWVVLAATTAPWVFRMSLIKAPPVSLALLIAGIWLLLLGRYRWLAVVSFLYVWTYGGFMTLAGVGVLWVIVALLDRLRFIHTLRPWHAWFSSIGKDALRGLEAIVLGMGLGFLLHPYAPNHIGFLWTQVVEIGIQNLQHVVSVGGEWYPYVPKDLLAQNVLVAACWIAGVIAFGWTLRSQTRESWLLLVVSMVWIAMTLKSRRYIEYAVPFAVMSAAVAFRDAMRMYASEIALLKERLIVRHGIETRMMKVVLGIGFLAIVIASAIPNWKNLADGYPYQRYEAAMQWATQNIPEGEILFHDDWDVFPVLFYYDDQHRYLTGLDPSFSYLYDPVRYQIWVAMTTQNDLQNLRPRIRELFHARYAVVDLDHQELLHALERSGAIIQYRDAFVTIFYLPENT